MMKTHDMLVQAKTINITYIQISEYISMIIEKLKRTDKNQKNFGYKIEKRSQYNFELKVF